MVERNIVKKILGARTQILLLFNAVIKVYFCLFSVYIPMNRGNK